MRNFCKLSLWQINSFAEMNSNMKARSPNVSVEGYQRSYWAIKVMVFASLLGLSITAILVGLRVSHKQASHNIERNSIINEFIPHQTLCSARLSKQFVKSAILHNIFHGQSPYSDFPPPGISLIKTLVCFLLEFFKFSGVQPYIESDRKKGWGSSDPVFERLIREVKPDVILELGTYLGASALHMANVSQRVGLSPLILCVDDFRGWIDPSHKIMKLVQMVNGQSVLLYKFIKNVLSENFQDMILPIPFSVDHATDFFCSSGIKADLIEVDAGHTFLSAWSDITSAFPLLSANGVMFGHDWKNKKVRRAANLFADMNNMWLEKDGNHWILRRKKNPQKLEFLSQK